MSRAEKAEIWFFVLVALLLRVGLYLAFAGRAHADETFQYLEQAGRLLGHPGIVPWEYVMGVRSWVLPGIVAGILWSARLLSADPLFGIEAVSVAFAALSVATVPLSYRFGRAKGGRAAAIVCACLTATTVELVYLAPHPLPDTLAAPLLFGAIYAADPGGEAPRPWRFALAGVLFGCCLVLRIQLAPAVMVGMLLAGGRRFRERLVPMLLGAAVPLLLSGLLDWVTLGLPFQSVWLYVSMNWAEGAAGTFGTSPWYQYFTFLRSGWAVLLLPAVAFAALGARRAPVLAAVVLAMLVSFSVVGHKEFRFLYPALPPLATLLGLASAEAASAAAARLGRPVAARRLGIGLALFWTGAWAFYGTLGPARHYWHAGLSVIGAMRIVDADPRACALAYDPADRWANGGGYSALRPGLPLFGFRPGEGRRQTAAFDYVFSVSGRDFAPFGFTRLACWKRDHVCLWHRPGGCDPFAGRPLEVTRRPG